MVTWGQANIVLSYTCKNLLHQGRKQVVQIPGKKLAHSKHVKNGKHFSVFIFHFFTADRWFQSSYFVVVNHDCHAWFITVIHNNTCFWTCLFSRGNGCGELTVTARTKTNGMEELGSHVQHVRNAHCTTAMAIKSQFCRISWNMIQCS